VQLLLRRDAVFARESAAPRAAEGGAYQEPAAGALGFGPGADVYMGASESADQEVRPEPDLYLGAGAWSTRDAVEQLLEGVYSEVYPDKSQDIEGMQKFFKQFSFPGGIGSHCTPETPGSIHEAANWDTACRMGLARRSTIPT